MSVYELKMFTLQSHQFQFYRYCICFIVLLLIVLCIFEWKNRR